MLISNGLQPIPAARLLGSRVRIPLRARIFVSCVCCARSGLSDELIIRYGSSTCVCVCVCVCARARDVIKSKMRRPRSDLACSVIKKEWTTPGTYDKDVPTHTASEGMDPHIPGHPLVALQIYIMITAIYNDVYGINTSSDVHTT